MKVQMAKEPQTVVSVLFFESLHVISCDSRWHTYFKPLDTLLDTSYTLIVLLIWLRVEGYTFEVCATLMTLEAFWMKTFTCCAKDTA